MKLGKRNLMFVGFMLFSLFFGAGNLIFPPFLGQNAGTSLIPALLGFLTTAALLPVLGVVVIAKSDGLDHLAGRVGKRFALVFTILIYLSIGPGLAIPRAASVPYEMSIAPYLSPDANQRLWMLLYSLVFFAASAWLALTPGKLTDRLGSILTPILMVLIVFLFVSFLRRGEAAVAGPQQAYADLPFLTGFCEGYLTMDTMAALNFGFVIAATMRSMGVQDKKQVVRYTMIIGIIAGGILAAVYVMLAYMGSESSGVYAIGENGAWILRQIVAQLYGAPGSVLLAAIFALACITTCVGLIASVAQYFADLLHVSYKILVFVITGFSFAVCNQGLTTILSISVPILNAIYPVAIILILLGLLDRFLGKNPWLYPCVVWGVAAESVLSGLYKAKLPMGILGSALELLPLHGLGFGWASVAVFMAAVSYVLRAVLGRKK